MILNFKKFGLRKRFNSTKLRVIERSQWVLGNSSAFLERLTQVVDSGMIIGGSVWSAQAAAKDVVNGIEDFACKDYRCLTLDCIAVGCDLIAEGVSFLPKRRSVIIVFSACTSASVFARKLRNECKKKNIFGCKH